MALLDYRPKADLWTGLIIGVGLLVAPVVIPMVAAVAKPVLKAVIKGGYKLYETTGELLADAVESVEDLIAEAKAEAHGELTAPPTEEV
jgi:hypothetical protein